MSIHLDLDCSKPTLSTRTATEIRQLEESVASIRLHARHQDPYEEWEKQTRKESFVRGPYLTCSGLFT